ncbi:MAG: LPS assembly lipoprotein LptE [bacterium]|nr:LPS assembly lipoprotein LptE [bacterium]
MNPSQNVGGRWTRRRLVGVALLAICMIQASGCAYFARVDLSEYAPAERTLFLHNFTNQSFQPDVNVELTEIVRREIARRENFALMKTRDEARLWVYGEISVYRKSGRMFDNLRTPTRFELLVAARIKVREKPGENLWFSREVSARVEYSEREGFLESEFEARQRVLRQLAQRVSNVIETEFLNRSTPVTGEEPNTLQ